jgi:hypothetical protein
MWHRIAFSTGNVFVSLVVGALLFGFVFIKYPQFMASILDAATGLKSWLTNRGLSPEYNNWVRVLLEERQLVLMGFVLFARLVMAILYGLFAKFVLREA